MVWFLDENEIMAFGMNFEQDEIDPRVNTELSNKSKSIPTVWKV